jgi:hypothetical protein
MVTAYFEPGYAGHFLEICWGHRTRSSEIQIPHNSDAPFHTVARQWEINPDYLQARLRALPQVWMWFHYFSPSLWVCLQPTAVNSRVAMFRIPILYSLALYFKRFGITYCLLPQTGSPEKCQVTYCRIEENTWIVEDRSGQVEPLMGRSPRRPQLPPISWQVVGLYTVSFCWGATLHRKIMISPLGRFPGSVRSCL